MELGKGVNPVTSLGASILCMKRTGNYRLKLLLALLMAWTGLLAGSDVYCLIFTLLDSKDYSYKWRYYLYLLSFFYSFYTHCHKSIMYSPLWTCELQLRSCYFQYTVGCHRNKLSSHNQEVHAKASFIRFHDI